MSANWFWNRSKSASNAANTAGDVLASSSIDGLFAVGGHVAQVVRRQGDQLRQHHRIGCGSGRDEFRGEFGGMSDGP